MSKGDRQNIIIADSDALDRFIKTDNTHVLHALYDRAVVPEQVYREMTREQSPREVREWMSRQREEGDWLRVDADPLHNPAPARSRGWGEKQAIELGRRYQQSGEYKEVTMLLEDKVAVRRAQEALQLPVTRGLFVLEEADRHGLIQPLPEEIKRLQQLPVNYKNERLHVDGKMVPVTDYLIERHYQRQEQLGRLDIRSMEGTNPDRRDFIAAFPSGKQARFSVGGLAEGEDVRGLITFHHYERLEQQTESQVLNLKVDGAQQQTYSHSETHTETHVESETHTQSHTVKF